MLKSGKKMEKQFLLLKVKSIRIRICNTDENKCKRANSIFMTRFYLFFLYLFIYVDIYLYKYLFPLRCNKGNNCVITIFLHSK